MSKVLIVEDDEALAQGLKRALASSQIETEVSFNLKNARKMIQSEEWSLILLDVNLPDGNGFDFLREIRSVSKLSVILLTANDLEMDIVNGLELGADDYITKPFSLAVLRARVNTQLRKQADKSEVRTSFKDEKYDFNFERMEFEINGTKVELSKTEQKLLSLLVANRGIIVKRETLLERVWTDGADFVDENALSVAIKRLRDKLDAQNQIKTVYGMGYIWEKDKA